MWVLRYPLKNVTNFDALYRVKAGITVKSGNTVHFKIFCQVKSGHCTHRDILANFFFPERGDQSASFFFWAKKFDA